MGKDPLSVVLFGAVFVLIVMYVLDDRASARLLERDQAARQIASGTLKGCEVGAIGHDGSELMVRCEGVGLEQVGERLGDAAHTSGFASVSVRDAEGTRVCPGRTEQWPSACGKRVALPERAALDEARRRRSRAGE